MNNEPREGTPAAALIKALTQSKGEPITEARVAELVGMRVAAVSQSMFQAIVDGWFTRRRNDAGSMIYGPGSRLCERLGIPAPAAPAAPAPLPPKPTTVERAGEALAAVWHSPAPTPAAKPEPKPEPSGVRVSKAAKSAGPVGAGSIADMIGHYGRPSPRSSTIAIEATRGTETPAAGSLIKPSPTVDPLPKPAAKKARRAGPPLPELNVDAIPVVRMGPVDGRQSPKDGKWQRIFDKLCAEKITGEGFPTMELPAAYAKTLQSYGYKLMKARPDGPKFKVSELGSKCILQRVG